MLATSTATSRKSPRSIFVIHEIIHEIYCFVHNMSHERFLFIPSRGMVARSTATLLERLSKIHFLLSMKYERERMRDMERVSWGMEREWVRYHIPWNCSYLHFLADRTLILLYCATGTERGQQIRAACPGLVWHFRLQSFWAIAFRWQQLRTGIVYATCIV